MLGTRLRIKGAHRYNITIDISSHFSKTRFQNFKKKVVYRMAQNPSTSDHYYKK